jgi:hypothetical protein
MESEAAKGCLGSADAMAEMISCNGGFAAAAPAQCISLRHHRADGVRSMVGGQQTQLDGFKDAARELECDDEQRFKERSGEAGRKTTSSRSRTKVAHCWRRCISPMRSLCGKSAEGADPQAPTRELVSFSLQT